MFLQGYRKRVFVNDFPYIAAYVQISTNANDIITKNSEGIRGNPANSKVHLAQTNFITRKPGNRSATVTVRNATYNTDFSAFRPLHSYNPFREPFGIAEGAYIKLEVYMSETSIIPWLFESLLILEVDDTTDARGLQPIGFAGKNDGLFTYPGD